MVASEISGAGGRSQKLTHNAAVISDDGLVNLVASNSSRDEKTRQLILPNVLNWGTEMSSCLFGSRLLSVHVFCWQITQTKRSREI